MKTAIRITIFGLILLIVASVQAEGTIKSVIAGAVRAAVADTTRPATIPIRPGRRTQERGTQPGNPLKF